VRLFVSEPAANRVAGFSIDPLTGALGVIGTHPVAGPGKIYLRDYNDVLYVPTGATIRPCLVDGAGALTDQAPVAAGSDTSAMIMDWDNHVLFAADATSGNVSTYKVDDSGLLTPGMGYSIGFALTDVVVDPSNSYLYVYDSSAGAVSAFTWDYNSAALAPITSSWTTAQNMGGKMAIHPSGQYLYITHGSSVEQVRINAGTGAPESNVAVYPTGPSALGVRVDPSGKFLYVANSGTTSISVFAVDAFTGALNPAGTFTTLAPPTDLYVTGTH
jgi:6-phosphogluconolactonase